MFSEVVKATYVMRNISLYSVFFLISSRKMISDNDMS
jgi:hypothetical protein